MLSIRVVELMSRLGDLAGTKGNCKCFAAFSLRTKNLTLICIYKLEVTVTQYFCYNPSIKPFLARGEERGGIAVKGPFFAGCFLLLPISEKIRDSKFQMIS